MPSKEDKNKALREELKEQITDNSIEELIITKQQLDELKDSMEEMQEELYKYKELLQRKQAEFVNYKKRVVVERENSSRYAIEKFLEDLLPAIDSLEKAAETSGKSNDINGIREGIINVEKLFKSVLAKNGIKSFESINKEFDPNYHEAMQVEESDKYNTDTVIKEWQKGYMMGKKVLRHSKVTVVKSTKPHNNNQGIDLDTDKTEEEKINEGIENIKTKYSENN